MGRMRFRFFDDQKIAGQFLRAWPGFVCNIEPDKNIGEDDVFNRGTTAWPGNIRVAQNGGTGDRLLLNFQIEERANRPDSLKPRWPWPSLPRAASVNK